MSVKMSDTIEYCCSLKGVFVKHQLAELVKKVNTDVCIHEILLIVIGMGLALMIECKGITNGAALVIPMAFLLIIFGWILRGSFEDIRE